MLRDSIIAVDFSPLAGCIPDQPRVTPTDIEGMLEHCGYFLFIECRRESCVEDWNRPRGQELALKRLGTDFFPRIRVIEISIPGMLNARGQFIFSPQRVRDLRWVNGNWKPTSLTRIQKFIAEWWKWAGNQAASRTSRTLRLTPKL